MSPRPRDVCPSYASPQPLAVISFQSARHEATTMNALNGIFTSWSQCISQCCFPVSSYSDEKPRRPDTPDSLLIIDEEPSFLPPPTLFPSHFAMEYRKREQAPKKEKTPKKRRGLSWSGFSVRKRFQLSRSSSSSRRPQISAPTNFQHLYSESFRFPDYGMSQSRSRPRSFHPLQLSIYMSDDKLSPILPISPLLPSIEYPSPPVTPPPRAFTGSSQSNDSRSVLHERSYSSMSFHIPRRPVPSGSVFESTPSDKSSPQKPQPARLRSSTSPSVHTPSVDDLVERVANALLERDRLQEQIDDVVERQSIYISSRPSTAHGPNDMEPMPEIPALPPNAPSFSERLSNDRPRTAPSRGSVRGLYLANSSRKMMDYPPLAPPLPLRLHPPLRKKKSFSRVSSWLLQAGEHKRHISLDSLTNAPKPVTGSEGFYQIAVPEPEHRSSFDSISTLSDWTAEEEQQTAPTSLSPSSNTPRFAMMEAPRRAIGPGEPVFLPQRRSVGIAV
ncbi:hypothetical protein F4780DRAFT_160430 [Xylariomycetidae sp. FL0641]|nr:hypothetical protein F4780DRAFT_160430 [Xylariomycetidae sp. FL0641]